MKQQNILIPKPSQLLRQAYDNGIKQARGDFQTNDNYCSRGAILLKLGQSMGFYSDGNIHNEDDNEQLHNILDIIPFNTSGRDILGIEDDLISIHKYGKHYRHLKTEQRKEVSEILCNLARINDKIPNSTFLTCAEYLEKEGL